MTGPVVLPTTNLARGGAETQVALLALSLSRRGWPVKQQLTVRLDADVVAWLRHRGRGYQTRLNRVLREAMLEDTKKSA